MIEHRRLNDLEDLLELLYEKLGEFEKELIMTGSAAVRFELKQRIKRDILPKIRQYEAEYWELKPREAIVISDQQATTHLAQLNQAVESIERIQVPSYPPELVSLLQDIRTRLDEPEKTASAKLKLVLPLIPMIASYELEMDTEGFMSNTWRSIRRLLGKGSKHDKAGTTADVQ